HGAGRRLPAHRSRSGESRSSRRFCRSTVSIRLRFALSYAAFLVAAGLIVLLGVYIVLRYVPNDPLPGPTLRSSDGMLPMNVESALVEMAGLILFGLAVVGIVGGWIISGVMLRPLERINK